MQYQYKEEVHPIRPNEARVLVTWPGYGWWHQMGEVVTYGDGDVTDIPAGRIEVWPAHWLHQDVSRLFSSRADALAWLRDLWEDRQARERAR